MSILIITGDFFLFLSMLAGILIFRSAPNYLKIITLQLILAFITEMGGLYLYEKKLNSDWLYDSYLIVDLWLITLAGIKIIVSQKNKLLIILLMLIATIVWVYEIHKTIFALTTYTFLLGSFSILIEYFSILFLILKKQKIAFNDPLILTCFSIIIYYGCNIPLFSFTHYLTNHYPVLSVFLYSIDNYLCIVRYSIATIAFLLYRKKLLVLKALPNVS